MILAYSAFEKKEEYQMTKTNPQVTHKSAKESDLIELDIPA